MDAKDRKNPQRKPSSVSDYWLIDFMREYPDDAACLDAMWREQCARDDRYG